jgi:hypothetical protein
MEVWIAVFLLLCTIVGSREGFDPFLPDTKPTGYPDQVQYGDLILSQKYIQRLLKNPSLSKAKKDYLLDLLNLLQFI